MDRCWTYSHRPTPPACGHTLRPCLAAISMTASTSFTPPQPAGVDLHDVDGRFHDQLLEHDAVLAHFAGGDLHAAGQRLADVAVARDVVGAGGLLDEPGPGKDQFLEPRHGLPDFPDLIRVDHQVAVRAQDLACDADTADVVLQVAPDLELDVRKPLGHGLLGQCAQLVVAVAEPAGGRGVARVAVGLQ